MITSAGSIKKFKTFGAGDCGSGVVFKIIHSHNYKTHRCVKY